VSKGTNKMQLGVE